MWILIISIIIFVAIIGGMFYLAWPTTAAAQAQQQGGCPCGNQCPCMGCGRTPSRCGCPKPKPRCGNPDPGCPFC
jgi:hypothetical protein